jgi:arylsulfatase A-like enzyme
VFVRDLVLRSSAPGRAPAPAKRAILVSLDALREDAIGAFGGGAATPHLDAVAAVAESFRPHWSAEISTKPSHASMLTGLPAAVHGCDRAATPLADEISTLAERLAAQGVATAAFLSAAPFFNPRYQLDQGFGVYRPRGWTTAQELRSAANWVAAHRDQPFFLFVHLYQAHSDFARLPYEAPGVTRAVVAERFGVEDYGCRGGRCASQLLRALNQGAPRLEGEERILRHLYDRGVESLDRELGVFFDQLRESGSWDDTLVIVTSDHGEQFGEHGWFLHHTPHEETLRVPLLVKWPGGRRAGITTTTPSTSLDLAPTLLGHFGAPHEDLTGRDLARQPTERTGRAVMVSLGAVRVGDRKLLLSDPPELYDLAADPAERRNLLPAAAAEAETLRAVWERYHQEARRRAGRVGNVAARPFTAEETEQLRALGYLQ